MDPLPVAPPIFDAELRGRALDAGDGLVVLPDAVVGEVGLGDPVLRVEPGLPDEFGAERVEDGAP